MFDVSFTELLVIGVVALIVIGPERLPKVARTVGHLMGRAQRYVNDVKSDIRREMELDELRNLRTEMEEAARTLENTVRSNVDEMKQSVAEAHKDFGRIAEDVKATADEAAQAVAAAAVAHAPAEASAAPAVPGAAVAGAETAVPAAVPAPAATPAASAAAFMATVSGRDGMAHAGAAPSVPAQAGNGPAPVSEPEVDPAQASLFPSDLLPPAVGAPDAVEAIPRGTPEKS